jgi:hypothetical protein
VKELSAAASAHVPIMSFSMDGVDFDVLFAQLPLTSVKVCTYLPIYLPTYVPTYLLFYLPTYLPTYLRPPRKKTALDHVCMRIYVCAHVSPFRIPSPTLSRTQTGEDSMPLLGWLIRQNHTNSPLPLLAFIALLCPRHPAVAQMSPPFKIWQSSQFNC